VDGYKFHTKQFLRETGRYKLRCNNYNLSIDVMRNCSAPFSQAGPDSRYFVGGLGEHLCQSGSTYISARAKSVDAETSGTEIAKAIDMLISQCGGRGGMLA